MRYVFKLVRDRTGPVKLLSYVLVALSRLNGLTDRILVRPGHAPPVRATREFVVARLAADREFLFDSGAALSAIYAARQSEEPTIEFRFRVTIKYYYRTDRGRIVTLRYDRYDLTVRTVEDGVLLELSMLGGLSRTDPASLVDMIVEEARSASGSAVPINVSVVPPGGTLGGSAR
ncbi:MAG TPA: hypothetical protein ENF83_01770 [Candidatus Korarchaeota archaeon]|nr:MAG: hypothetical protein DRO01_01890 [Candidatus Korarchaeota archaeon]HDI86121.1 hypothetical protein [Candidatus Korarchaeota archaeon]